MFFIYFKIYGTDGLTKIGGIRKKYAGFISEAFTTADSFTLEGMEMEHAYIVLKFRLNIRFHCSSNGFRCQIESSRTRCALFDCE